MNQKQQTNRGCVDWAKRQWIYKKNATDCHAIVWLMFSNNIEPASFRNIEFNTLEETGMPQNQQHVDQIY